MKNKLLENLKISSPTELEDRLHHYDYKYYIESDPEVTDSVYDELIKIYEEWTGEEWDTIGSTPTEKSVKHEDKMLSLSKVWNDEKLEEWAEGYEKFIIQPKYDGTSLVAYYKDGKLIRAATRGDGDSGMDITMNAKKFIPTKLEEEFTGWVRGEAVMKLRTFKDNYSHKSNPRNFVSGLMNRKTPCEAHEDIDFIAFEMKDKNKKYGGYGWKLFGLEELGFQVSDWYVYQSYEDCTLSEVVTWLEERRADNILRYPCDGAVITIDDIKIQEELGVGRTTPNYKVAKKFKEPTAETVVKNIQVNTCGGTGILAPIADVDPIQLDGTRVGKISVHNQNIIKSMNVNVGDVVEVEKKGGIIPQINRVVEKRSEGYFKFPDVCPECKEPVKEDKSRIKCVNQNCPTRLPSAINRFTNVFDIKGFGNNICKKLASSSYINSIEDMFHLAVSDLERLDGVGEGMANKLINRFPDRDYITLSEYLRLHGIDGLGKIFTDKIEKHYKTLEDFKNNMDELEQIDRIGTTLANKIRDHFEDTDIDIESKIDVIVDKEENEEVFRFCITGRLSKSRKEYKSLIEDKGHEYGGLSGNTDYLVVGDKSGSKVKKAKDKGVNIINEEKFIEILEA